MKDALAHLQTAGVRGLILDLRGNPGGLFDAAVQVSELFIGSGVVVYSQSQLKKYNRPFPDPRPRPDIANPLLLPVAVLVDGETASSAEVLAGALKEQYRSARLFGQTTYGKGSIQSVIPLRKSPGGIRITVAHLFSPSRQPYTGRGIVPDVLVDGAGEACIAAAQAHLQSVLRAMFR